jgi:beta-glucosidase
MMKLRLVTAVLLLALAATLAPAIAAPPQSDIERKIDALIAQMTLEEKLGQLQQLDGFAEGNARPEHPDMIRKGLLGSTLNVRGAKQTNELQRIAMEQSRLKIPVLFAFDVLHGYRTVTPVPLGEAASWDPAAAERAASIAADEASATWLRWTFAPMVDIARDPRWGRIVEGSGEDPYLGAAMARARVLGFQGKDYSAPNKVVACAKHWVGYGATEGGRDYNTTDLTERVLRDVYFPPFKAAVEAGVGTFMSAFNDLDGVPASGNPWSLKTVLREEWKFDGIVVSDYESVREMIQHGIAADGREAARIGLNAGVDMEMVSRLYNQHGPDLVRANAVSMATIDEAVRHVLRVKFRLGLFDRPYTDESREAKTLLAPAHVQAAREIAARSCVLLKNDNNVLPLAKDVQSVAVIGPLADDQLSMLGSWSGDGKKEDAVTVLAGVKAKLPNATVTYAKGCDVKDDSTAGIDEAVAAAKASKVAILVVGESADMSGEAAVRSTLDLPGRQLDLVKAVLATGTPTAVVLMNGRPLSIGWVADNAPAILEAWYGGVQSGNAVADVLFGDVNPGGKLPVTFPRNVGQVPIYYNHANTGRPPAADNKYTSKYLDIPWAPLYPFGHGLSYTTFKISDLQLSAQSIRPDGSLRVSAQVENTGSRAGDEVVQLYVRDLVGSVTRPVKELKGFERVTLKPGEKRRVEFTLTPDLLGFHNREMRWVVEPGKFTVTVGNSSVGGLEGAFEVAQ